eukprot:jgi/Bigna1/128755/aug1.7_g3463
MYDTCAFTTPIGWDNPGRAFIAGTGEKLSGSDAKAYAAATLKKRRGGEKSADGKNGCKAGDIVEVLFDSDKGCLSFLVNEIPLGVAFSSIPMGPEGVVCAVSMVGKQRVQVLGPRPPPSPLQGVDFRLVVWGGCIKAHGEDQCDDNKVYMLGFENRGAGEEKKAGQGGGGMMAQENLMLRPRWTQMEAWGTRTAMF